MKHFKNKSFLSGATTIAILIAGVIIFGPRNAFAYTEYSGFTSNINTAFSNPSTGYFGFTCPTSNFSSSSFVDYWVKAVGETDWVKFVTNGQVCFGNQNFQYLPSNIASFVTDDLGLSSSDPHTIRWGFGSTPDDNYFQINVLGGYTSDTTTRIISVTPSSGSTVATSTAFSLGAFGYINPDDFESDMFVRLRYMRNQDVQASVSNPTLLTTEIDLDLSSSGFFNLSTTTSIVREGMYLYSVEIRNPSVIISALSFFGLQNFLGNYSVLTSTSTNFYAARPTAYDNFIASSTALIEEFYASSTASLSSCSSWTSFSLSSCLSSLFAWDSQAMSSQFESLRDSFLSYAPWGYVTRFVEIASGNATSTLPSISYTFPASFPFFGGQSFGFNTTEILDSTDSYLTEEFVSSSDGENIWQIVNTYFSTFVYLGLAIYAFKRILGLRSHHHQHL